MPPVGSLVDGCCYVESPQVCGPGAPETESLFTAARRTVCPNLRLLCRRPQSQNAPSERPGGGQALLQTPCVYGHGAPKAGPGLRPWLGGRLSPAESPVTGAPEAGLLPVGSLADGKPPACALGALEARSLSVARWTAKCVDPSLRRSPRPRARALLRGFAHKTTVPAASRAGSDARSRARIDLPSRNL